MERICIPEKKTIKMLHRRFVQAGKTLTDLQILNCKLHQNAFGGRACPVPLAVIRRRDGGEGKERIGNREGR